MSKAKKAKRFAKRNKDIRTVEALRIESEKRHHKERRIIENRMRVVAIDKDCLIAMSVYRGMYRTTNGGESWRLVTNNVHDKGIENIVAMHGDIGTVDYRDLVIIGTTISTDASEATGMSVSWSNLPKWGAAGDGGIESDDVLRGK